MARRTGPAPPPLQGSFRVEMLGSQESLDLDCGKFFTIWDVVRRYREFSAVDILLREKYPSRAQLFPFLPSKKYIGSSLSADFVDKRQRDLGYYVTSILHSCPLLVQDEIIDTFLEIKRHILERARDQERRRLGASSLSASFASSNGSGSLLRVQE
ncbi:Myosin-like protein, partial [Globisporangium splendens]